MQINKTNSNSILNKQNINNTNSNNQKTSFKGSFVTDSMCLSFTNFIENGGFARSFLVIDGVGTVGPRIYQGAERNKEENNGELNLRFAAKEGVREIMSGPSMFIIPYAGFGLAKNYLGNFTDMFGKACNMHAKFIKNFGNIHAQSAQVSGNILSKEEFFKNSFVEIIKNAKEEKSATDETITKASEFAKKLFDATNVSKDKNNKDELSKTINGLFDDFVGMSKKQSDVTADFTVAKVQNASASFKSVVNNMIDYADDVVKKVAEKSPCNQKEFIEDIVNKKTTGRFVLNLSLYAAILGFFQYIPMLYNKAEGDENAGLKGLMKKETLHDKELNANYDDKKADKSNPSFGSWASTAKSITGNGKIGKFASQMEFDGCSMSFYPLSGVMAGGILYPRIKNARDDYDKEEIIRRDVVTCVVMCIGEKELRKAFSKLNEATAGLVLAYKDNEFSKKGTLGKVLDYLNPVNGVKVLSSEQIRAKYTNINQYNNGVKGFCEFIDKQGGNLSKVFSLTDKSKEIVTKLLGGKDISTADNKTITDAIDKAKDSKEVKELAELFHPQRKETIQNQSFLDKLFKRTEVLKDNPWVEKARTLNARFTTLSVLVLVPLFLGFMLPIINERATKKRIEEELSKNAEQASNKNSDSLKFLMNDIKKHPIFSEMFKNTNLAK